MITLMMDGLPITTGTLDREALRQVVVLEAAAPGLARAHTWKVVAEPALPGLGFALSLHSWVPWAQEPANQGLALGLPPTMTGKVGNAIPITVTAIAPAGVEVRIEQALPAGVQVDTSSLDALVAAGTLSRFESHDGKVALFVPPLAPGHPFAASYRVIPTLAGKLHSAASSIVAGTSEVHVPPTEWIIR